MCIFDDVYEVNVGKVRHAAYYKHYPDQKFTLYCQLVQMKRSQPFILQTPIKKYQQKGPTLDQLAIIESDISQPSSVELFHFLAGHTLHHSLNIHIQSPDHRSNRDAQLTPPPLVFHQDKCLTQTECKTVSEMKINLQNEHFTISIPSKVLNHKGCRCRQSKCQKKYCECLRMGLACNQQICGCRSCNNKHATDTHNESSSKTEVQIVVKGCNCKKSRCSKKYCECHNGGRKCSQLCHCSECLNRGENAVAAKQLVLKLNNLIYKSCPTL